MKHPAVSLQTTEIRSHSFIIHAAGLWLLNLGHMYRICHRTNSSGFGSLCAADIAASPLPVTDQERQIWMALQHDTSPQVKHNAFKGSISAWLQPATPIERCRVVSAKITLISLGRMSLAVLGGEQSGMEGGRQRVV